MKTIRFFASLFCSLALWAGAVHAQTQDSGGKALPLVSEGAKWTFANGAEFPPGGKGSVTLGKDGDIAFGALNFDFTEGGGYVAALRGVLIDEGYSEIRWRLQADRPVMTGLRLIDASGQTHQYGVSYSNVGQWQLARARLGAKAPSHFGGKNDGVIYYPIRQIWIIAERRGQDAPGQLRFADFKLIR